MSEDDDRRDSAADKLAAFQKDAQRAATRAAATAAAKTAARGVTSALSAFAEDFLSFAEGELDRAKAARGDAEPDEDGPQEPAPAAQEAEPAPADDPHAGRPPAVRARLAREARAAEELARLKEAMAQDKPPATGTGNVKKTL